MTICWVEKCWRSNVNKRVMIFCIAHSTRTWHLKYLRLTVCYYLKFNNFRLLAFSKTIWPYAYTHGQVKNTGSMKILHSIHFTHYTWSAQCWPHNVYIFDFSFLFYFIFFFFFFISRHSHSFTTVSDVIFYLLIFEFSLCRHSTCIIHLFSFYLFTRTSIIF